VLTNDRKHIEEIPLPILAQKTTSKLLVYLHTSGIDTEGER